MDYNQALYTAENFCKNNDIYMSPEQITEFAGLILEASLGDTKNTEEINSKLAQTDMFQ